VAGRAVPSPVGFATTAAALPAAVGAFATLFRQHRLDAVYIAHPLFHVIAGFGARAAGIPAICHLQGIAQSGQRIKVLRPVYRALCRASGCTVVAISRAVADAYGGPARQRPRVIPNGIDTARFRPLPPDPQRFAALGVPLDGRPVVGLVGTLESIKRMERLPEFARYLLAARPDARILVVGADLGDPSSLPPGSPGARPSPYVRSILDGLAAGGADGRVVLAGRRDDVPELLAGMDVLVHFCDREGFGLSLAEAGAAEVPVVAFDAAAVAEIVEDRVTGLLVPDPQDFAAMAARVVDLLADPDRRRALGTQARQRVQARFSEAAFVGAFADLLRQCIADRSIVHAR
jgi:glycosyltransferase involved in cell wall biosynthesis